jgi:hypothetical protein
MKPDSAVARRFLMMGGTLLPAGIAASATGLRALGAIVTLGGAALLIAGLHTFGRAGPDEGKAADAGPASKDERG